MHILPVTAIPVVMSSRHPTVPPCFAAATLSVATQTPRSPAHARSVAKARRQCAHLLRRGELTADTVDRQATLRIVGHLRCAGMLRRDPVDPGSPAVLRRMAWGVEGMVASGWEDLLVSLGLAPDSTTREAVADALRASAEFAERQADASRVTEYPQPRLVRGAQ